MFENILYATDFSESPFMLPCVGIIGKTKKIHLLHVVSEDTHIGPQLIEPRMLEAKGFLEETLNVERNRGVEVDVHLMPGVPTREICDVAKRVDASLVVVNYHMPEGVGGSATMELIRNCDRNVLVMTGMSSDAVERAGNAMDDYCVNLFRRVLCPLVGNPSLKLIALRSLKDEVKLDRVAFLCLSKSIDPEKLINEIQGMGLHGGVIMAEETPKKEVTTAAETTGSSIIMLDARTEMGLALSLVGTSQYPLLILK